MASHVALRRSLCWPDGCAYEFATRPLGRGQKKQDAATNFARRGIRCRAGAPGMISSLHLLRTRQFLPLFVTQMLGAFNDNLFKNAMVLFVVYEIYNDETAETWFSAITTGVFILPFFLLSALSGQLADARDKAKIIRIVKFCEIL